MNTNNRNVRLQLHVVLLTVMEHDEDLIKKVMLYKYSLNSYFKGAVCHFQTYKIDRNIKRSRGDPNWCCLPAIDVDMMLRNTRNEKKILIILRNSLLCRGLELILWNVD